MREEQLLLKGTLPVREMLAGNLETGPKTIRKLEMLGRMLPKLNFVSLKLKFAQFHITFN